MVRCWDWLCRLLCCVLVCFSKNLPKGEIEVPKGVGCIFALFIIKTSYSWTHVIGDTSHTSSYDMLDQLVCMWSLLLLLFECLRILEASIRYLQLLRDDSWAHILDVLSMCISLVIGCYVEMLVWFDLVNQICLFRFLCWELGLLLLLFLVTYSLPN